MSRVVVANAGQYVELSKYNGAVSLVAVDDRSDAPSFVGKQYVGMDLSRQQINTLIRRLRTIRDEVYGADE
jgi:hypothetical protein